MNPQPPQKSMVIPIALTVLISALIFGGLGYYVANNQNATELSSNPSPSITSNTPSPTSTASSSASLSSTKKYTSTAGGYTLSYDANLIESTTFKSGFDDFALITKDIDEFIKSGKIGDPTAFFKVTIYPELTKLPNYDKTSRATSLEKYLELAKKNAPETVVDYKTASVNSYKSYEVTLAGVNQHIGYFVEHNGEIFVLTFPTHETVTTFTNIEKDILNTFRFTE